MRMTRAVAAGTLALALLGAACANDDGGNAGSGGDSTGGAVTGSTGSSGSSGGGAYGGGGGYGSGGGTTGSTSTGGGSSVLTLTQVNYQFTPARITVNKGDTITVSKIEMPAQIEFRDSLPKTMIGKLSKKELKAEEEARRRGQ